MILRKIVLPMVALSVFFVLASCEADPIAKIIEPTEQTSPAEESLLTEEVPLAETIEFVQENIEEEPGVEGESESEPTPIISHEDLTLYAGAIELNNAAQCEKIQDQGTKDKCKIDIKAKAVIDEAVRVKDESICSQLEGQKVEVCKMEIQLANQRQEDFRDSTVAELEVMSSALESGDIQICDQLKSERKKENCKTNVQSAEEINQYYDQ